MSDRNRTFKISGGTFERSIIANGDVYGGISESRYTAEDLLVLLEEYRRVLIAADPRINARLEQLAEELVSPNPDPEIVRGGWMGIARIAAGTGVAAEGCQRITELVQQLFGR